MVKLTKEDFNKQINRWQLLIAQANITLPNGKSLPKKFFHVFLGVGESTFKKMTTGTEDVRAIQPYTVKTIRYLNKLEPTVFLDEIRLAIPEYTAIYKG